MKESEQIIFIMLVIENFDFIQKILRMKHYKIYCNKLISYMRSLLNFTIFILNFTSNYKIDNKRNLSPHPTNILI